MIRFGPVCLLGYLPVFFCLPSCGPLPGAWAASLGLHSFCSPVSLAGFLGSLSPFVFLWPGSCPLLSPVVVLHAAFVGSLVSFGPLLGLPLAPFMFMPGLALGGSMWWLGGSRLVAYSGGGGGSRSESGGLVAWSLVRSAIDIRWLGGLRLVAQAGS